jgi:hypothetical protein
MKKISLALVLIVSATQAMANLTKAPTNFTHQSKQAVFVDFTKVNYKVTYDVQAEKTKAVSTIEFIQETAGYPLLDSVNELSSVLINGENSKLNLVSAPDRATKYRMLDSELAAGTHTIVTQNAFSKNINYKNQALSSAYWTSDLSDRSYLESYMPANLEFDQSQMTFEITILNASRDHVIYANGKITKISKNNFKVEYPKHFTSSSMYFHIAPKGQFDENTTTFKSVDGREIPVRVYRSAGSSLETFTKETHKVLHELEADYGPFPHPEVTIYGAGQGGMEYCGATRTSFSALGHELTHSYFARGIIPARGNSGWVDEAVASWRDKGYRSRRSGLRRTTMAGHSIYRRSTDRAAYSSGAKFMEYLHGQLNNQGGLKPFLKDFKNKWLFKPFFTSDFISELEAHSGRSFEAEFKKYIFGNENSEKNSDNTENPYHPKLSAQYIKSLL